MTKESILNAIIARVGRAGFTMWRIGVTNDPVGRRMYWGETEHKSVTGWTQWAADSLSDAQEIESHFINDKKMKVGTGGDLSPDKTVYVYIF
jgi:hypothetical protein